MKTTLEILNNVQIASPCSADWDEMIGDDFRRFCSQCEKHVYNLSALSADAVIQLVREKEGKLCGRFFRRADGTILTADCPVGVQHRIPRRHRWAVLAASLAGLMSFGGCGKKPAEHEVGKPFGEHEIEKPVDQLVMGGICPIPNLNNAGLPAKEWETAPPPREVPPELAPPPREAESAKN